jgi:hypothetical protein
MLSDDANEVYQFPPPLQDDPPGMEVFAEFAAHEAAHAVVTTALGLIVERILVTQLAASMKRLYSGRTACALLRPRPACDEYAWTLPTRRPQA